MSHARRAIVTPHRSDHDWKRSSSPNPPILHFETNSKAHDEWQVAERRYLSEGSMAKLTQTSDDGRQPKEVKGQPPNWSPPSDQPEQRH
jgi:hypothetical protein